MSSSSAPGDGEIGEIGEIVEIVEAGEIGEAAGGGQVIRNSRMDGSFVLADLVRLGCRVRERPRPPLLGLSAGEGSLRCKNAILRMLDGEAEADLMLRLGFENIISRSSFVN
jgi:hypothetical protein